MKLIIKLINGSYFPFIISKGSKEIPLKEYVLLKEGGSFEIETKDYNSPKALM